MGNIKKIIAEEEMKRRETRERSFYDSPVHKVAIDYSSKAGKIYSFAPRIFKEFSSETDWKFEYKGTTAPYNGDCLAYYSAVRGKGIHLSRKDIIIGIKEKRGGAHHQFTAPGKVGSIR